MGTPRQNMKPWEWYLLLLKQHALHLQVKLCLHILISIKLSQVSRLLSMGEILFFPGLGNEPGQSCDLTLDYCIPYRANRFVEFAKVEEGMFIDRLWWLMELPAQSQSITSKGIFSRQVLTRILEEQEDQKKILGCDLTCWRSPINLASIAIYIYTAAWKIDHIKVASSCRHTSIPRVYYIAACYAYLTQCMQSELCIYIQLQIRDPDVLVLGFAPLISSQFLIPL